MVLPQLITTLDQLSPDLQAEILHYAEYLASQQFDKQAPATPPKKYRQAGAMKGMFTMAEDFDEPEEDFDDTPIDTIREGLYQGWQDVLKGNTKPVSQLWDGMDVD